MSEGTRQYRLDQLSIPRLFFALLRGRFTGTLSLSQPKPDDGPRTVWLRGGMPIFTDWVSPADVLGEVLLAKGLATPAQCQQGLVEMAQDGGLLGQVLKRAGVLDARGLAEALRTQCGRKLVHAFALRDGAVSVVAEDHEKGKQDDLAGQVNVLRLILLGISSHYDEARIRAEMGAAFRGRLSASSAFSKYQAQFGFRKEDVVIVQQVSRGTKIEELVVPGLSRKRIAQIAYTLWACQMLQTGEETQTPKSTPSRPKAPEQPRAAEKRTPTPTQQPKPAPPKAAPPPKARPAATAAAEPARASSPAAEPSPSDTTKIPTAMIQEAAAPAGDPEFEADLAALEERVKADANAFELFAIPLDFGRKQIRQRWAELSGKFHPDRLEPVGLGHLRERVEPVFAALSEAQGILSDKTQREDLKKLIESGADPTNTGQDVRKVVRNALEAEMIARDADKLLKGGSFTRALELYDRARALHPGEPEIQAAAAWCRYNEEGRTKSAAEMALGVLATAVEDQPKCARAHYYRGLILLQQRDEDGAKACFVSALQADGHFTDAERQLRAIKLRKKNASTPAEESKKKGGLRGLFGRKG